MIIKAFVVLAIGLYSGTYREQMQTFRSANDLLYVYAGIDVKPVVVRKVRDAKARRLLGTPFYNKYYQYALYMSKAHVKADMNLAIVPFVENGGAYYLAGFSTVCSKHKFGVTDITMSAIGPVGFDGSDKRPHSIVDLAHEMGHAAGAKHDSSWPSTIMHPDALRYVSDGYSRGFSKKSIKEMRQCQKQTLH